MKKYNYKKNNRYIKYILAFSLLALLLPNLTLAALQGIKTLLRDIGGLINPTIKIVAGLAVIYFFWGMGQFILHSGEEKSRSDGKNKMLWGIIALFVIFSIWGILGWMGGLLNFSSSTQNSSDFCPSGFCDDNNGGCYPC